MVHFDPLCLFLCFKVRCPVSGNNRLVFFEDFSDHSYSCLLPSTKSPLIIAISFAILEQSGVILSFVFPGQAVRYNEFGYKSSNKKNDCQDSPTQKISKSKILNPPKSFDHPGHLKSGVPPPLPPPELRLQKVLKSISYCELEQ